MMDTYTITSQTESLQKHQFQLLIPKMNKHSRRCRKCCNEFKNLGANVTYYWYVGDDIWFRNFN